MMLFEVDADSASQSIQTAQKTHGQVNRAVLHWPVDNNPETELAKFVVRNQRDKKLAHDEAGGADSIKVVLDRKRLSATSMTAEAARFGKTMSSDRIYHGTARAPARTIAWGGDVIITPQQFWSEVNCKALELENDKKTKLTAAVQACKLAQRTAPADGDTKYNHKFVLPRPVGVEEEEEGE